MTTLGEEEGALYPNLDNKNVKSTQQQNNTSIPSAPIQDNEDEKKEKEDSASFDMMNGITTMGDLDVDIGPGFETEGKIDEPLQYNAVGTHVGLPDNKFNDKDIEEFAKTLHDAISPKLSKILTFKTPDVKQTLIEVLGPLNNAQRVKLTLYYNEHYKTNLQQFIRKKFKAAFADLLLSLLMPIDEFRAYWFERCLKKGDMNLLSIILCPLSPAELTRAQNAYNEKFKKKLLDLINEKTKSWFAQKSIFYLYQNLLTNKKPDDSEIIDENVLQSDVEQLMNASNGKNVDKKVFIEIFTCRSNQHLAKVAQAYTENNKKGRELIDTIEKCFKESNETGHALKIILLFATQRTKLFCTFLAKAMKTPGPNYEFFTRIIVDHCEVDLSNVLQLYGKMAFETWCKDLERKNPLYFKTIKYLIH